MKKDNVLLDKSYGFALRIIKAYRNLCEEKKELVTICHRFKTMKYSSAMPYAFTEENLLIKDEHRTSNVQHRILNGKRQ